MLAALLTRHTTTLSLGMTNRLEPELRPGPGSRTLGRLAVAGLPASPVRAPASSEGRPSSRCRREERSTKPPSPGPSEGRTPAPPIRQVRSDDPPRTPDAPDPIRHATNHGPLPDGRSTGQGCHDASRQRPAPRWRPSVCPSDHRGRDGVPTTKPPWHQPPRPRRK